MSKRHVVIVGGGISGLSTAYFLSRRASDEKIPLRITMIEASGRFGGVLQTLCGKDFHMEAGADAFDGKDPVLLDLCKTFGLQDELLPCESTLKRVFISRKRDLQPLDLSFSDPGIVLKGAGLSFVARARLFCEFLMPSRKEGPDESSASFIRRRFGSNVLDVWGEPLIRGILMGEAEKLSLSEYFPHWQKMEREQGSVGRAILGRKKQASNGNFFTLRGGLDRLVPALLKELGNVYFMTPARAAALKKEKTWEVCLQDGRRVSADMVCLALPAPEASKILAESAAPLAVELAKIRYDSVAAVNMVFRREEIPRNFPQQGFIVPSREKKWPFACLKVIGKTEDGAWVKLRAFVSGTFQSDVYGQENEWVQRTVLQCLADEWGIQALPSWISTECYPQALPQYETGHAERMTGIEKLLENYSGLFLTGNGYHGFGISECVRGARDLAARI